MHETNCVVRALNKITGRDSSEIAQEIAQHPNGNGGPAFDENGACYVFSFGTWLEKNGWRITIPLRHEEFSIPPVALLVVENHAFAVVNGRLYGASSCSEETRIELIATPPEVK